MAHSAHSLEIFELDLQGRKNSNSQQCFQFLLVKCLPLRTFKAVQAIEPDYGIVAVHSSNKVQLIPWQDSDGSSMDEIQVPTFPDDNDLVSPHEDLAVFD